MKKGPAPEACPDITKPSAITRHKIDMAKAILQMFILFNVVGEF